MGKSKIAGGGLSKIKNGMESNEFTLAAIPGKSFCSIRNLPVEFSAVQENHIGLCTLTPTKYVSAAHYYGNAVGNIYIAGRRLDPDGVVRSGTALSPGTTSFGASRPSAVLKVSDNRFVIVRSDDRCVTAELYELSDDLAITKINGTVLHQNEYGYHLSACRVGAGNKICAAYTVSGSPDRMYAVIFEVTGDSIEAGTEHQLASFKDTYNSPPVISEIASSEEKVLLAWHRSYTKCVVLSLSGMSVSEGTMLQVTGMYDSSLTDVDSLSMDNEFNIVSKSANSSKQYLAELTFAGDVITLRRLNRMGDSHSNNLYPVPIGKLTQDTFITLYCSKDTGNATYGDIYRITEAGLIQVGSRMVMSDTFNNGNPRKIWKISDRVFVCDIRRMFRFIAATDQGLKQFPVTPYDGVNVYGVTKKNMGSYDILPVVSPI